MSVALGDIVTWVSETGETREAPPKMGPPGGPRGFMPPDGGDATGAMGAGGPMGPTGARDRPFGGPPPRGDRPAPGSPVID